MATQTIPPPKPQAVGESKARSQTSSKLSADQAREENAYTLGVQAYLWGFPLAEYGRTLPDALKVGGTGWNSFRKYTALKTAKDRFVVTPNNVTIDAYSAFDVSEEPLAIFVPKITKDRWYIVQLGDHFDEIFHNIGGTKGGQPGVYVVTDPDFNGPIPGEMTRLPCRTKMGVAALRIFANGEADLPNAVAAQQGFQIMPLSAYLKYGLAYKPPKPAALASAPQDSPEGLRYFERLGYWMKQWLGKSSDASDALVASFHQIGLSVGKAFEWRGLDEATKCGLVRAATAAEQIVDAAWQSTGETTNGWKYTLAGGRAGHDLALRAALCKNELGAQLSDQVIYPNARVDDHNQPLDGSNQYVLHFEKGKQPAVSLFWNLAMYAPDMLFIENEINRYSIGSTTDGLKENADGSLTLYLQKDKPAPDKTSNWLPAPAGPFNVTMRFYGPETSVLDGSYRLPAVERVN
jgi:hypothetical protein